MIQHPEKFRDKKKPFFHIDTVISIMQFLSYPVSVSVDNVYESPSDFPAITLCKKITFDYCF